MDIVINTKYDIGQIKNLLRRIGGGIMRKKKELIKQIKTLQQRLRDIEEEKEKSEKDNLKKDGFYKLKYRFLEQWFVAYVSSITIRDGWFIMTLPDTKFWVKESEVQSIAWGKTDGYIQ